MRYQMQSNPGRSEGRAEHGKGGRRKTECVVPKKYEKKKNEALEILTFLSGFD